MRDWRPVQQYLRNIGLIVGVVGWLCLCGVATVWGQVTPKPPVFLNQPRRVIEQGALLQERIDLGGAGWYAEKVSFALRKAPAGMQIASLGQRGCCRWWALLSWLPAQKDVGKHDIEIEAVDDQGKTYRQTFVLEVLERNDPPEIRSVPLAQVKEGNLYAYDVQVTDPDPTKDTLEYRLLSAPAGMTIDAKGQIRWLPTSAQVGHHEVALEVSDGAGATAQQAFVLAVQNVEQPPQFVSQPLLGAVVGQPYLYQLRARDPDTPSQLTFRLNSTIAGMKLSPDGLLTWTPKQAGQVNVTVDVTDQTGLQSSQQWAITVVSQNKVPEILSDPPTSVLQGQTFRYTLQIKDDENDTLSFVLTQAPPGLQLATQPQKNTADVIWTPKASDVGVHSVVVRVDDQKGGVVWERFQIRVLDVNDPPQITSQPTRKTMQGRLYRYQVRAVEPDGEPIQFALHQAPTGMQIDPATGLISWLPAAQSTVQSHTVTVVVTDPQGASSEQSYTLEVLESNDPPRWDSQPSVTAAQDKLYTYQAKVTDVDAASDEIWFRLVEHPMTMQMDASSGLIRWIPGANDVGSHQVVVEALDARGGVARQAFVLTVKNQNDAPVVLSKPVRTAQAGRLYLYRIRVSDADSLEDGDNITFSFQGPTGMVLEQQEVSVHAEVGDMDVLATSPSRQTLRASAVLSWTPKPEDASRGDIPIKIQISDGQGGIVTQEFSLRVLSATNKLPQVKKPEQVDVEEGKPFRYTIEASDPDQDTLVLELLEAPEGLTLDANKRELQWTPRRRHMGTWRVEVRIDDQKGGVVWWPLTIKVKPQNHAPQIVSTPQTDALAGLPYVYALRGVDPDQEDRGTMRWHLKTGPAGMLVDAQRGVLSWSPGERDVGVHVVQVELLDRPGGHTVSQQFVLQVRSSNQPPQITSPAPTSRLKEGELFTYAVLVLEPNDRDALRYRLLKAPSGMTIGAYSGLVSWTPTEKQVGQHTVQLEVRDSHGATAVQTFTLEVDDQNTAPIFLTRPMSGAVVGQTYRYDIVLQDVEQDAIQSIKLVEQPIALQTVNQMKLDVANQTLTWVPGAEHRGGTFHVALEVTDQRGASAQQHFLIRVFGTNRAPTWKQTLPSGMVSIPERQLYTLALQAEDPDGDGLRYTLLEAPQGMVMQPRTGQLSWLPAAAQVGTHRLVVAVRDGRGGELRAQWNLIVTDRNDAPRIVSQPTGTARAGQLYQYHVVAEDLDALDTLQFTLQQAPAGMTMDRAKGLLQWTPQATDVGRSYLVVVRVIDKQGAFDSQVFRVDVAATNRAPQIVSSPPQQASEGRLYSYQIQASDPDADDVLQYVLLSGPSGMMIGQHNGWLRWMPGNQDVGRVEVTVQVRDSHGATTSQTFAIVVNNLNNPPRFLSPPCTQAAVNTAYKCVLVVEDIDPNTQSLYIDSIRVPSGWSAQVSSGGGSGSQTRSVFLVVLTWEPQPQDIGSHLIELRISDGIASDRLIYTLDVRSNEDVPIAIPGEDQTLAPGEVHLDGRKSLDAKGQTDGLTYEWRLVQGPQEVTLVNPNRAEVRTILRKAGTYIFSLVVGKDGRKSAPGFVRVQIKNLKPSAQIWAPSAAQVGQTILLDGSSSADANNDGLVYQWQLWINNKPQTIWKETSSIVRFKPGLPGVYRFALTTSEDLPSFQRSGSSTSSVEVVVHDASQNLYVPHAVILAPTGGNVRQSLLLDGSRSRSLASADNAALSYQWTVLEGSQKAQLTTPTAATTSFVAEEPGFYRIGLVVTNTQQSLSSRQTVWGLSVQGNSEKTQLPVARVVSAYGFLDSWFQLDASHSTGPGGAQLQFFWEQQNGAATVLRDSKTAKPSFFVLHPSPYEFQLRVQDSGPQSAPVTVRVLVNKGSNKPPIADAGASLSGKQSQTAGQLVELDGSASHDPDQSSEKLVYRWKQVSGFPTALNADDTAKPSFVPLTYGILRFSLEVYDGIAWSHPSFVDVVVHSDANKVPHADAGPDQSVRLGQSITLDGSKSYDLDPEDRLVYHWLLLEPVGQQISLNLTDPQHPSFTAKDPNIARYVFGLRVDDGKSVSLEDTVVIRVSGTNQSPTAQIQVSGNAVVGQEFVLDGSSSWDPDNDKLTYLWKQLSGPHLTLGDVEKSTLVIKASQVGTYRFQLQVHDGLAQSAPASIVVQINEPEPEPQGCQCQSTPSHPASPWSMGWLLLLGWLCWTTRRRWS